MQKTLLLFILAIFFNGCIERGQNLKPVPVHTPTVVIKQIPVISKVESKKVKVSNDVSPIATQTHIKKQIKIEKNVDTIVSEVTQPSTKDENNFFTLSDETKNKISGFFIIVIGIIILL